MAKAIDKQTVLDLIIEVKRADPETGSFAEWLAEYLVEHLPTLTPPNEPLTLEQLREMDGQWIIIKAFDADISGIMPAFIKDQFATTLCELGSKAIVPDLCEVHFSFNEYGKTWLAYRRPPEGETDGK